MAAPLRSLFRTCSNIFHSSTKSILQARSLTFTLALRNEEDVVDEVPEVDEVPAVEEVSTEEGQRKCVDAETSIRYLNSEAFVKGYGDKPVWFHYRRNFKGQRIPETRLNCFRKGKISTASPCPVCRDEYLVLNSKNTKLLEHFISPHTGEIYPSLKTGLCQKQHATLQAEVMKAWNEGRLEMKIPFRYYDYKDYTS